MQQIVGTTIVANRERKILKTLEKAIRRILREGVIIAIFELQKL
jgi:hypothetical protein